MSYYEDEKNVEEYVKMAEGYDGQKLIDILRVHLPKSATVLELGMGPGVDLELLGEHFQVTGSDQSTLFLERYRAKNPEADLILLDAAEMVTDRRFDCIYSNKVLHHLTRDELKVSLQRQAAMLNEGGLLLHSLWYGDSEEEMAGMRFCYYTEETFGKLVGPEYTVETIERYSEMDPDDSMYVLLRKK